MARMTFETRADPRSCNDEYSRGRAARRVHRKANKGNNGRKPSLSPAPCLRTPPTKPGDVQCVAAGTLASSRVGLSRQPSLKHGSADGGPDGAAMFHPPSSWPAGLHHLSATHIISRPLFATEPAEYPPLGAAGTSASNSGSDNNDSGNAPQGAPLSSRPSLDGNAATVGAPSSRHHFTYSTHQHFAGGLPPVSTLPSSGSYMFDLGSVIQAKLAEHSKRKEELFLREWEVVPGDVVAEEDEYVLL